MSDRISRILGLTAIALAVCVLHAGSLLAQVSIPHVFSANTPARAAEVNENFDALAGAINSGNNTPITNDGSYAGLQYGAACGLPNVVVLEGTDAENTLTRYSVRVSCQTGTVAGASYAYVREFAFIQVNGPGAASGISLRQGTNALATAVGDNEAWVTEVYSWSDGTPMASALVTDTRTDEYRCINPAISGQVHHCRVRVRDVTAGDPTRFENESRILTQFSESFTVSGLTFSSGGISGAFIANAQDRDTFLIAKNVGMVLETRRFGTVGAGFRAGNPNWVGHFAIWYRVNGTTQGTLTPFWTSGGKGHGRFFTP